MRDYKFRAWIDDEKKYAYSDQECNTSANELIQWIFNAEGLIEVGYIHEETNTWVVLTTDVEQYTGLKDIEQFKVPRKLYTGDVVEMHQFLFDGNEYENEIIGVLEYDEELACVCLTKIKQQDIKKYMGYDNQEEFEHERIPVCTIIGLHECSWTYLGNIHDNPDLLGEVRE